jgi:hypothetical protein
VGNHGSEKRASGRLRKSRAWERPEASSSVGQNHGTPLVHRLLECLAGLARLDLSMPGFLLAASGSCSVRSVPSAAGDIQGT